MLGLDLRFNLKGASHFAKSPALQSYSAEAALRDKKVHPLEALKFYLVSKVRVTKEDISEVPGWTSVLMSWVVASSPT